MTAEPLRASEPGGSPAAANGGEEHDGFEQVLLEGCSLSDAETAQPQAPQTGPPPSAKSGWSGGGGADKLAAPSAGAARYGLVTPGAGRDDPARPLLDGAALSSPGSPGSAARLELEGPADAAHPIPLVQRVYMVAIFTLTAALLYADQNLMAPNLTAIAREFHFNDEQRDRYLGGYIAAAFFGMGAPSALVIGFLSDRVNRRNLLFAIVLLGEGPCLATFFVTRYWQLLLLRMLTSISIGGALPLVCSLVGDLFFVRQRTGVMACVQVAVAAGLVLGHALAGFVGSVWGWRWPFVLVALPALAAAALMLGTTREPPRGCTEAALSGAYASAGFQYSERISLRKAAALARTRSNLAVVLQGLPGSLPWGVLMTFFNDFLSQQKGMTVQQATSVVMVAGGGGAVGVLGGGFLGQRLHALWRPAMPVATGACVVAASWPVWAIINSGARGGGALPGFMALGFLGAMLASPPGPNARGILLNVNEPEVRGVTLAMQTVLDDLGKGLGPLVVAFMISAWGREKAFNVAVAGWLPCGLIFACAALTLGRDEDAMQERLRRRVAAAVDAPLPGGAAAALGGAPLRPGGEAPAPRPRAVDVEVQVPHALILLTQAPGPGLAKQYSGQPVPLVAGDVPRAERNGAPAGASPV